MSSKPGGEPRSPDCVTVGKSLKLLWSLVSFVCEMGRIDTDSPSAIGWPQESLGEILRPALHGRSEAMIRQSLQALKSLNPPSLPSQTSLEHFETRAWVAAELLLWLPCACTAPGVMKNPHRYSIWQAHSAPWHVLLPDPIGAGLTVLGHFPPLPTPVSLA